ncbi:class I SAM-dependent methyltransferase [Candidatus Pacearchaeota archaeon]|nr:class I SAM-dependent methyltransferase [Candidatus Pacearchaeota archaeon]
MKSKRAVEIWNERYKEGVHWEGLPSREIVELEKYLKKKDKILDLGCGSGRNSIYLARKGYEVWGVDISEIAIEKAKHAEKIKNLNFSVGNSECLEFNESFFDAVYCNAVLHFTNMRKSASEIFRVLKNDGIAYLSFLLNMKYTEKPQTINISKREDLIKTFDKFRIIKKREYEVDDTRAKNEEPHKHDILDLILTK